MHVHHLRGKDFFVPTGYFQITMSAVGLQHKTVPGVGCNLKQAVNGYVQFVTLNVGISLFS
jgi:hypothetical protein